MRVMIVKASRCPSGVLWPRHFRADGSCFCEAREDEEALKTALREMEQVGREVAREARRLLAELGD